MISGIGEQLAEARRNRGLSVKDVEAAIKIRGKYISALEREDMSVIEGEAYVVAFIRSYAAFLELDKVKMVAAYREQNRRDSQGPVSGGEEVVSRRDAKEQGRTGLYVAGLIVVIVVLVALRSAFPGAAARNVSNKGSESSAVKAAPKKPAAPARTAPAPKVTVELSTTAPSGAWLRVTESTGTVLFEGIMEPEKPMKWESGSSIKIRSGKPSVVDVSVNGRSMGPLNTVKEVEYKAGE